MGVSAGLPSSRGPSGYSCCSKASGATMRRRLLWSALSSAGATASICSRRSRLFGASPATGFKTRDHSFIRQLQARGPEARAPPKTRARSGWWYLSGREEAERGADTVARQSSRRLSRKPPSPPESAERSSAADAGVVRLVSRLDRRLLARRWNSPARARIFTSNSTSAAHPVQVTCPQLRNARERRRERRKSKAREVAAEKRRRSCSQTSGTLE
mmetsp:Transcript_9892/g.37309  ORF Transcript_9892/g.37309 Transcript_9892/m.37309 type:complete len:215 (+) Transcript_9892:213-857(+)